MKAKLSSLLLLATVCGSVTALSQTESTSFVIGNDTYYLHKIAYHDLSSDNPEIGVWNQNIVADKQYVYLADHSDNSNTHLTIKRFNALTGTDADNIVISEQDIKEYWIDELTDEERCFYLVDCHDDEHFILFINPPFEGYKYPFEFYFYLIDKNGSIECEFLAKGVPNDSTFPNKEISEFGIPEIIGNPTTGNFEILLPLVDDLAHMTIAHYYFENKRQKSYTAEFYDYINNYTKPSVYIIDDSFMLIDDISIYPSLYAYTFSPNRCFGELTDNHINAHGCDWFDFDGHRLLYSGDIEYSENDPKNATTQFNIGLWDKTMSRASTISFDNYAPLTTLNFGKSSINLNEQFPYTYRQFMAVSDYGNTTKHLHFYVPGEFLATYQLNKYERPTDVENIINIADNHTVSYRISDKNIIFDCPVADVSAFNMTGHQIFHSTTPVKSINFANFVKGTYIIATPYKSFKILL